MANLKKNNPAKYEKMAKLEKVELDPLNTSFPDSSVGSITPRLKLKGNTTKFKEDKAERIEQEEAHKRK